MSHRPRTCVLTRVSGFSVFWYVFFRLTGQPFVTASARISQLSATLVAHLIGPALSILVFCPGSIGSRLRLRPVMGSVLAG